MASPTECTPNPQQSELMQKVCGMQELTSAEKAEACILFEEIVKLDGNESFLDTMVSVIRDLKESAPESLEAKFLQVMFITRCFGFIPSPGLARDAFAEAGKEIPPFLLAYVLAAEKTHEECSKPTNSRAGIVEKPDEVEDAECLALVKLAEQDGFSRGKSLIHPTSSAEAAAKVEGLWDLLGEERAGRF